MWLVSGGDELAARATAARHGRSTFYTHYPTLFARFLRATNVPLIQRACSFISTAFAVSLPRKVTENTGKKGGGGKTQRSQVQRKSSIDVTRNKPAATASEPQQNSLAIYLQSTYNSCLPMSSSVMTMFGGKSFLAPRHRGSLPIFRCSPAYARIPLQDLPRPHRPKTPDTGQVSQSHARE